MGNLQHLYVGWTVTRHVTGSPTSRFSFTWIGHEDNKDMLYLTFPQFDDLTKGPTVFRHCVIASRNPPCFHHPSRCGCCLAKSVSHMAPLDG